MKLKQTGFTIVELLIVIVVIGILAAITIVAFNGIQERARVQQANSELNALAKAIQSARINTDKTLFAITGSGCTNCSTQARYELTLDLIGAAAGMNLSDLKQGDSWGNKYVIDENEDEQVANPCRRDGIGVNPGHTGVVVPVIPFYNCPN